MKKNSVSQLKKLADKYFSIFIRTRDDGVCFTCGVKKPINEMQAGHFFSRAKLAVRYHEKNVHCQCVRCNIFLKGNTAVYAAKLAQKYGEGILSELSIRSQKLNQFKAQDYEDVINRYKP